MSKQLTLSANVCALAMAVLAFASMLGAPRYDGTVSNGAATAHGSLISVLIQS